MKIITNLTDRPLPMPDGRMLPAKGKLRVPDHIANGERVRSWGLAVTVKDYVAPVAEDPEPEPQPAEPETKPARGKVVDKPASAEAEGR